MTKVEQVLQLIPPEDMHYVEEWKNGTDGFKEYPESRDWLKKQTDDTEVAKAMAHAIGLARKYDSEQRTKRGASMSREECLAMEKRNMAFTAKCNELGLW